MDRILRALPRSSSWLVALAFAVAFAVVVLVAALVGGCDHSAGLLPGAM